MLVNSEGEQKQLSCFERDDNTEAYMHCSLTWKNQLHIFGGNTDWRQISRLNGYRLERIGTLSFDHFLGACSVMADQLYLCFSSYDPRDFTRCRRSTGPLETFTEIAPANQKHRSIKTGTSESKSCCLVCN